MRWDDLAAKYPRFFLPFKGHFDNSRFFDARYKNSSLVLKLDSHSRPIPSQAEGDPFDIEDHYEVDFGKWPYKEPKLEDGGRSLYDIDDDVE